MPVAAVACEPLGVFFGWNPRAVLRKLRHGMEHVCDWGALSGLSASVAVDVLSSLRGMVAAHRLVRAWSGIAVAEFGDLEIWRFVGDFAGRLSSLRWSTSSALRWSELSSLTVERVLFRLASR